MIEIVPSRHAREALQGRKEFTDFEKATLIWNSPISLFDEKMDSLKELAEITDDKVLKSQIEERLAYEEEAFATFKKNDADSFVFVVLDEEREASGFFSVYEMAHRFGIRMCQEYEMNSFMIQKQLVFGKDSIGNISEQDYIGVESVWASYNKYGKLKHYYSHEVPDKLSVDDYARFEKRFFKIPSLIEEGTVAKIVGEDTFVLITSSGSDWDKYMKSTTENTRNYDFFDIQMPVHELSEDGVLSHLHTNPMFLEPVYEVDENLPDKERLCLETLFAAGTYFKNQTEENNVNALELCRKYVDFCLDDKKKYVKTAKTMVNLLD